MKTERQSDGTIVIKHFPMLMSGLILLMVFVVLKTLAAPLPETPARYDSLPVGIIA